MTEATVSQDPWWESLIFRSMLGVVLIPAWFVFVNLFNALTPGIRHGTITAPDVYWWCATGIALFALFAWFALARTRAGKPYLPGWSLALLSIVCLAFLLLMLIFLDPAFRESNTSGPLRDFYSTHLYAWAWQLQVPVTLGITICTGLYRLIPKAKWFWATLTYLVATVPFVVFAAFLLDYKDLI